MIIVIGEDARRFFLIFIWIYVLLTLIPLK